jgi:DNA (cytosine-5)-methyltransferase 1
LEVSLVKIILLQQRLKNSKGLIGKKGVLWWSIHNILTEKENKPKYLFLENVDRLLISPSGQRGRDFAIILKSLNDLGYAVEWRVVNAAEFGMPQRRRRIFILAYLKGTTIYESHKRNFTERLDFGRWNFGRSISCNITKYCSQLNLN